MGSNLYQLTMSGIVSLTLSQIALFPASADDTDPAITVSAAKRAAPVTETVTDVHIITAETLEKAGVTSLLELDKVAPELKITKQSNSAYTNISLRGIFSADYYSPAVQVYIDGILQDQALLNLPLINVARVEILKGPQGSLYGHNAHAGVIHIISKQPGNEISGQVGARLSNQTKEMNAAISAPLIANQLYAQFGYQGQYDRGQTSFQGDGDEKLDDGSNRHVSTRLTWAPEDLPIDISLGYQYDFQAKEDFYSDQNNWKQKETTAQFVDRTKQESHRADLKIAYHLDDLSLTSTTGYQARDMNRTLVAKQDESQMLLTQELRLTYDPADLPVSATFGGYYEANIFNRSAISFATFTPYQSELTQNNYALYGDVTYHATDRLHLNAGGRLSYDTAELDLSPANAAGSTQSDNWFAASGKIGASYDWSDHVNSYASLSQGYKPGGFNRASTADAAKQSYDPETSLNYEIGLRSSFWDQRVNLTASVYYNTIKDIQLYTGTPGQQLINNHGDAVSYGLDMGVDLYPVDGLHLNTALVLNRARLSPPNNGADSFIPYSSPYTARFGISYDWGFAQIPGQFSAGADVNYYGRSYLDVNNSAEQSAYALAGLSLGYELYDISVKAYAKNLFNQEYKTYQSGTSFIQSGAGREVGAEMSWKF